MFSQLSSDDCGDADLDDANLETQVCCQSTTTVDACVHVSCICANTGLDDLVLRPQPFAMQTAGWRPGNKAVRFKTPIL